MKAPFIAQDWRGAPRGRDSAVALGNFDGVHLGHRRVLEALREFAEREGLEPLALTFDPHPRRFFDPSLPDALLTPPAEKEALIRALGVIPVTLRFDPDLAGMVAEDFARGVLGARLRGRAFFIGPDHRFGKGARGDASLLRDLAGRDAIHVMEPLRIDGEVVSSSAVRKRLAEGAMGGAARMLGHPYELRGTVSAGSGRGRELGFPTANLEPDDPRKLLPAFGVHGGFARLRDGSVHPAVANIGIRPTFGGGAPTIEVHLPEWSG